jgi:hypothetical protein
MPRDMYADWIVAYLTSMVSVTFREVAGPDVLTSQCEFQNSRIVPFRGRASPTGICTCSEDRQFV